MSNIGKYPHKTLEKNGRRHGIKEMLLRAGK